MAEPPERGGGGPRTAALPASTTEQRELPRPRPWLVPAQRADTRAVTVVHTALEAAIAEDFQRQVNVDAGRGHGANQWAALAAQVLTHAAAHITIEGDADVVARVEVGPAEVQDVDDRLGHQATPSGAGMA